jgi:hypothetical protein
MELQSVIDHLDLTAQIMPPDARTALDTMKNMKAMKHQRSESRWMSVAGRLSRGAT